MKFVLAAILMLVLGDLAFARGANTAMLTNAVMHFFHSAGEEGRSSIFSR
ncbi:hypothetical protein NDN01_24845 [Sphingomonas sp. QA11]|nr:hypothetical protein [Sphingomonas sp. QA11]WCM27171.1 hypothetical protein NDN01_24845 [Sphingomonas sp. QA11]